MSEESTSAPVEKKSILERFYLQDGYTALWTVVYALAGTGLFVLVYNIPAPYTSFGMFKLGLIPALAVIPVVGAIRGPIAGFITGYLGIVIYDLVFMGAIVTMTLPAIGYGLLGLIVGLGQYQFDSGKSLIKLSILSVVGFVFTVLIVVAVGLVVESLATLVVLGFLMLPLMTMGIPSVLLLTPIFARLWHLVMSKFFPSVLV
ncbi:MAG: hypothetical protein ACXAEF_02090 [Candidatus Thorarchaeota archaeon]|jgi:uncharacterized membrane protein